MNIRRLNNIQFSAKDGIAEGIIVAYGMSASTSPIYTGSPTLLPSKIESKVYRIEMNPQDYALFIKFKSTEQFQAMTA